MEGPVLKLISFCFIQPRESFFLPLGGYTEQAARSTHCSCVMFKEPCSRISDSEVKMHQPNNPEPTQLSSRGPAAT